MFALFFFASCILTTLNMLYIENDNCICKPSRIPGCTNTSYQVAYCCYSIIIALFCRRSVGLNVLCKLQHCILLIAILNYFQFLHPKKISRRCGCVSTSYDMIMIVFYANLSAYDYFVQGLFIVEGPYASITTS